MSSSGQNQPQDGEREGRRGPEKWATGSSHVTSSVCSGPALWHTVCPGGGESPALIPSWGLAMGLAPDLAESLWH